MRRKGSTRRRTDRALAERGEQDRLVGLQAATPSPVISAMNGPMT